MTYEAKTLMPLPSDPEVPDGVFDDVAGGGTTVLEAPAGYVLTERLALAFRRLNRHPLWLRLGPEDRDPATLLLSLIAAARRLHGDAGETTLRLMRERPGPIFGWPPLFAQLALDLRCCMTSRGAMVLEDLHHLSAADPACSMIDRYLVEQLTGMAPCVLVGEAGMRCPRLGRCMRKSVAELRLPTEAVEVMLEKAAPTLNGRGRRKALTLIGGRAGILAGLRELATTADRVVEPLLERAASRDELVARMAEILLADVDGEARSLLGLAARMEYAHPAMTAAVTGGSTLPPGPWLQRLEEGWVRVRPCWRRALRTALSRSAAPSRGMLRQLADWLLRAGACEQAISLYLEIADPHYAAGVIATQARALMDLGQWATVDGWLDRLPEDVIAAHPELSRDRADIAAARGDTAMAHRWYDVAATQYAKYKDVAGECRSMLAGSAVAAEEGDLANALSRAHSASSLANAAELATIEMWATWQIGRLALAAGDTDGALASFSQAASQAACKAASDTAQSEGACGTEAGAQAVLLAGELARQIAELRDRRESLHEAQTALIQAEHETIQQLSEAVRTPETGSDKVFATYGWSRAPVPLKLPGLLKARTPSPAARVRPLIRMRRALLTRRDAPSAPHHTPSAALPVTPAPLPVPSAAVPVPPAAVPVSPAAGPVPPAPNLETSGSGRHGHELAVHLLGPLYVAIDDIVVEEWLSPRCRSLFGYLLTHREPWAPREVLMEAFWPESAPDAARNSLNVAIHGLRRTLRTVTDIPMVVHAAGAYRINREVRLWLDVEEFDRHVESGRRFEELGDLGRAAGHYEFATGLYRGDFLADDPYEEWAALTRERLRLAYLDALGHLSTLYFEAGQYSTCASLCQRIVERDPCREDAHRRLMRCYSRQGQPHLALMQYRACARALEEELGVAADPATTELHEHIRRHERV